MREYAFDLGADAPTRFQANVRFTHLAYRWIRMRPASLKWVDVCDTIPPILQIKKGWKI
jgi:hypothetical protein